MSHHRKRAPMTARDRVARTVFWRAFGAYWGTVACHAALALALFLGFLAARLFVLIPLAPAYLVIQMARAGKRCQAKLKGVQS